ncbi:hypothetical protein AALB39_03855 [Lachnospiraceae bacterium 54-53]
MSIHYSHPKGFVGRQLIYKIYNNGLFSGVIVGGSATLHLPGRDEFFEDSFYINGIINNNFFHLVDNHGDKNLGTKVLSQWRKRVIVDWEERYKDRVIGFESLVELPRTGSMYKADNWTLVGQTKEFTCRREPGIETGVFTGGKRVWNTNPEELKPKLVFCKLL